MDIKKALNVSNTVRRLEEVREAITKISSYKTENKLKGKEYLDIGCVLNREENKGNYPVFLKTYLRFEDMEEALFLIEKKLVKEVEEL